VPTLDGRWTGAARKKNSFFSKQSLPLPHFSPRPNIPTHTKHKQHVLHTQHRPRAGQREDDGGSGQTSLKRSSIKAANRRPLLSRTRGQRGTTHSYVYALYNLMANITKQTPPCPTPKPYTLLCTHRHMAHTSRRAREPLIYTHYPHQNRKSVCKTHIKPKYTAWRAVLPAGHHNFSKATLFKNLTSVRPFSSTQP
jgi:hypothetical protein